MKSSNQIMKSSPLILKACLAICIISLSIWGSAQDKKALTVTDIMKFRQISSPSISHDGEWIVHAAVPDRGDPEVIIYSTDGEKKFTIERGERPVISGDGKWVAAIQAIHAVEKLKSSEDENGAKQGLVLLNTLTGEQEIMESVESFSLSNDSRWLTIKYFKEERKDSTEVGNEKKSSKKNTGTLLKLHALDSETRKGIPFVLDYNIDSTSSYLAYTVADTSGAGNGVFIVNLQDPDQDSIKAFADTSAWGKNLSWTRRTHNLAFLAGKLNSKDKPEDASLYIWSPGKDMADMVLDDEQLEQGWKIYHENRLTWTRDGKRLFVGIKPKSEIISEEDDKDSVPDPFDTESILGDRELDVWHWNDPLIMPNQKVMWNRVRDRTYVSVYHLDSEKFVQLADTLMSDVSIAENPLWCLGSSNLPHSKKITWDTRLNDYYLVNLATGERRMILEEFRERPVLSPDGRKVVYYREGEWYMLDSESLATRNLTEGLGIPFADEDHDFPQPAPGYGTGGWVDGSGSVLIYDKYDIWQFPSDGSESVCLTGGRGRKGKYKFRIRDLDRERIFFNTGEQVLATAYHDLEKFTAIYSITIGRTGINRLMEEPKKFNLVARAKDDERILYTRQSYTEFPDLWVSDPSFRRPKRISHVNPQVSEFAWGEAELVEWSNMDGRHMQGVLIRPGNYQPGKKYPVLVYYYRFMTDRLYSFNQVVINHRPCFPFYASNGYAIFLPDIRFDVGYPGYSATKCLVPGVQKLIDMGIADPDGIALHGHSWSGYQTAFVITQTNIFACAIAGAPVSNMTSAYSGIRLESGLARQMQYEQGQSRIGGSLWETPERFIENSPVFFADRISTPLLIQFGDVDGAVPWQQGIELYLAMRRLEKDCVFLQYRGEPHHLRKYPNKLDYTLKFMEYLDHYCKGEPAPEWLSKGIPYTGK